jgi:hypothetical protein
MCHPHHQPLEHHFLIRFFLNSYRLYLCFTACLPIPCFDLLLDTMRASNPETKVESRDIDGSAVSSMLISLHLVEFIMLWLIHWHEVCKIFFSSESSPLILDYLHNTVIIYSASPHLCILFIIMLYFTEDSFVLQVDKNILYDVDKNYIIFKW